MPDKTDGIRATGVTSTRHRPDGRPVIDGLDLVVPSGSLTAVVGPSGIGKSTLLDLVAGIARAGAGTVHIGDEQMQPRRAGARARLRARSVAAAHQSDDLLEALTVDENVRLGQDLAGRHDPAVVEHVLEHLGIHQGVRRTAIAALSGGERRRVAVARAAAAGTPTMLCDEPTNALDAFNAERVRSLLRDAAHHGKAVLVVTHDLELAQIADCTLELW